jgi:rod shape-determining protein MreD
LSALIFVGLQTVVQRSRLFLMGQPYVMVWLGFAITAFAYTLCFWILMSLSEFSFASIKALTQMLVAGLLSIMIFPLASLLLQGVHRLLPVTSSPFRVVG